MDDGPFVLPTQFLQFWFTLPGSYMKVKVQDRTQTTGAEVNYVPAAETTRTCSFFKGRFFVTVCFVLLK